MQSGLPLLGVIILVGVLGNLLFSKTRIPESLFLLITGLLLGPVFGILPQDFFRTNMSFFVTIALIIVLLNSGLNLDIYRTMRNAGYAALFTLIVFFSTVAFVTFVTTYFFDWPVLHGVFLGIVGSGTTTVTISHLVEKLRFERNVIDKDTKNLLILESVVNDLTVITGASILLALLGNSVTGQSIVIVFFNELIVSSVAGAILGVGWVFLYVKKLHGNKLTYIFTVGVAFAVYGLAEFLSLNGAITVMAFSLIIGNYKIVADKFRVRSKIFDPLQQDVVSMKKTDVEFTFMIRTFFFVLLGIVFDISVLSNKLVIYLAFGVLAAEIIARYFSCVFMSLFHKSFKHARFIRTTLVASGVTSTLVAFLSIEAGIDIPYFAEIVLMLVVLTTVTSIVGTWVQESRTAQSEA